MPGWLTLFRKIVRLPTLKASALARRAVITCGTVPMQVQQAKQKKGGKAKAVVGADFGSCGSKRYCGEMRSCAEAQYYYRQCGVSRLDGDKDGIPCEKLCGN